MYLFYPQTWTNSTHIQLQWRQTKSCIKDVCTSLVTFKTFWPRIPTLLENNWANYLILHWKLISDLKVKGNVKRNISCLLFCFSIVPLSWKELCLTFKSHAVQNYSCTDEIKRKHKNQETEKSMKTCIPLSEKQSSKKFEEWRSKPRNVEKAEVTESTSLLTCLTNLRTFPFHWNLGVWQEKRKLLEIYFPPLVIGWTFKFF